jgi:hypothetical protein
MPLPPVTLFRQFDTHRLIPSLHLPGGDSALAALAGTDADLQALLALDAATNDRLLAERQRLPGIGLEELVFAVPHAAPRHSRHSSRRFASAVSLRGTCRRTPSCSCRRRRTRDGSHLQYGYRPRRRAGPTASTSVPTTA